MTNFLVKMSRTLLPQALFILALIALVTSEDLKLNLNQNDNNTIGGSGLGLEKLAETWKKPSFFLTVDNLTSIAKEIKQNSEYEIIGLTDIFQECLEGWEAPLEVKKAFPYHFGGYDEEDRAVWIAQVGKYDVRKIVEEGGPQLDVLDKYLRQAVYRIMKSVMVKISRDNKYLYARFLADFDGLNIAQLLHLPTIKYGLKYTARYSALMQNFIGPSVIVNANYVAELAINIGRPLIGGALNNFEIYGTNKAKWAPLLRRHFPADIIPESYGGTKKLSKNILLGK